MKQLNRKALLIVVMFSTIVAYAEKSTSLLKEDTNSVTNVKIEDVMEGSLFLIKDSNGLILYREQIENTGVYSKRFDLTNLPDADYYFELDNQEEIKIIPFMVEENIAEFIKDAEYELVKPEVTVKNDHVYISKLSLEEQSWEIDVYFDDGYDLAFSEKLKNTQNLSRVYDFSSSRKGNYTIVFSSEGRIFRNSINIQ